MRASSVIRPQWVNGTSWGADRVLLLRLYRAIVRSVLDYGSIVYASAAPSTLKFLDSIHNVGIRLATGAFRTSRIDSLLIDAGEPSLKLRREILLGSYGAKVMSIHNHPAERKILHPSYLRTYENRHTIPQPAGIRLHRLWQEHDINVPTIMKQPNQTVPPWRYLRPIFDLRLVSFRKQDTPPVVYKAHFQDLQSHYPEFTFIYTDGSATNGQVGCGF